MVLGHLKYRKNIKFLRLPPILKLGLNQQRKIIEVRIAGMLDEGLFQPLNPPKGGRKYARGAGSVSQPISRVLSRTVIHLGLPSPAASSGLPEFNADHVKEFLFGLAPGGVYLATECYHPCGALLPHPFTLTLTGGLLSVALSLESPPPDVIRRRASVEPGLSSPACAGAITRLSDPHADYGETGRWSSLAFGPTSRVN